MLIVHILFKTNHIKALYLIFILLIWNSCAAMDDHMRELLEMANQGDTKPLYEACIAQIKKSNQPGATLLIPQVENFFTGTKLVHKASYDPKKAKEHLEVAIAGIDEDLTAAAQDLLALLYRDHFSKEDNTAHTQANKLFTDLKKKGFSAGALGLALYAMDRQDYPTAYSLLENALRLKEYKHYYTDASKPYARLSLAHLWENGLIPGKKADIKQACRLFEQADSHESEGMSMSPLSQKTKDALSKTLPLMGRLNKARLILTDKLPGDKEEALNIVQEGAEKDNEIGVFYGCHLIMSGKNSEGIARLEKSLVGDFEVIFLAKLQLGIAYSFGYGVEQDATKAQDYFNDIVKYRAHNAASRLAYGYMQSLGLGGIPVNKEEAMKVIRANIDHITVNDTVQFGIFFPQIKAEIEQLKEREEAEIQAALAKINAAAQQTRERAMQELLEGESRSSAKKNKAKATATAAGKIKKKQPSTMKSVACLAQATSSHADHESSAPITELETGELDIKGMLGTIEVWNDDWFPTDDGSTVEKIDYDKKIVVANDLKMEEKLLFIVTDDLHKKRRIIPPFRYHERIALRQGDAVPIKMAYNHTFAQKLDYLMQQFGHYVPILNIRGETDEALTGLVIRQKKDGQIIVCRAEYTFGKKGNDVYVYHRLLRPITDQQIISEMIEKYVQG